MSSSENPQERRVQDKDFQISSQAGLASTAATLTSDSFFILLQSPGEEYTDKLRGLSKYRAQSRFIFIQWSAT